MSPESGVACVDKDSDKGEEVTPSSVSDIDPGIYTRHEPLRLPKPVEGRNGPGMIKSHTHTHTRTHNKNLILSHTHTYVHIHAPVRKHTHTQNPHYFTRYMKVSRT